MFSFPSYSCYWTSFFSYFSTFSSFSPITLHSPTHPPAILPILSLFFPIIRQFILVCLIFLILAILLTLPIYLLYVSSTLLLQLFHESILIPIRPLLFISFSNYAIYLSSSLYLLVFSIFVLFILLFPVICLYYFPPPYFVSTVLTHITARQARCAQRPDVFTNYFYVPSPSLSHT
jgi:hypothetical protein